MSHDAPWYAEGLRFECRRCGRCCRGEPGYVWVTDDEVERMAEALGLLPDEFVRAYVRRVGTRRSLRELPGGDCILWRDGRGCAVYRVRPVQCQTFPFWNEHIRSRAAWERLARSCPGVNQGKRHSLREIAVRLKRRV